MKAIICHLYDVQSSASRLGTARVALVDENTDLIMTSLDVDVYVTDSKNIQSFTTNLITRTIDAARSAGYTISQNDIINLL